MQTIARSVNCLCVLPTAVLFVHRNLIQHTNEMKVEEKEEEKIEEWRKFNSKPIK